MEKLRFWGFVFVMFFCIPIAFGALPTVSITNLYSDDDGGTTSASTELTPNDEMTLLVNVSDADTLSELSNITFVIWYETTADYGSADGLKDHMTYLWNESDDIWTGTQGTWTIDTGNSADPNNGSSETTYNFKLVFTPGKIATKDISGEWKINVTATDDAGNRASDVKTTLTCASYSEVTAVDGSFAFGSLAPGATNQSATTPADGIVEFTSISNADYDLSVSATDWTDGVTHTIDLATVESLGIDKDVTHTVVDAWVTNTPAVTYNEQTATTSDTTGASTNMYPVLTVPSNLFAATYTTILTVGISID